MTKTIAQFDAELTEAGYDMTRSHVALVIDGIVYGVGRTEEDARQRLAELLTDADENEISAVPITEYQTSLGGVAGIESLVRRY